MKRWFIAAAACSMLIAYSAVSAAQCTVDTDCKGNRICQAGQCVDAAPAPVETGAPPVAVSTAMPAPAGGFKPFVVGAFFSMGMGLTVGDLKMGYDQKPRFAGGGGAYFDFYVMEMLAIEAGIGFIGKGYRVKEDVSGYEVKGWQKVIAMEIPLGVKLNIALSGKSVSELDGSKHTDTFGDDEWDNIRRFNLGPRIALGYAIPIGPVAVVPGISWSMDVINYAKNDYADADVKARCMNLMFNVGGEFGFGG
jgi:hypothetical protein